MMQHDFDAIPMNSHAALQVAQHTLVQVRKHVSNHASKSCGACRLAMIAIDTTLNKIDKFLEKTPAARSVEAGPAACPPSPGNRAAGDK